ncbi:MAG: hypothetical protein JO046_09705 [Solirubrobacterales bacterium]|nr:hypothetical protein [Solirubrobacterales bacterium]MBV9682057.1 hypothetical protein [Solirubrobacterales bacterium]
MGITIGPILAGVLISLTSRGPYTGTQGFQAMWIVCAGAALTSIVFVRRLQRAENDRRELERE